MRRYALIFGSIAGLVLVMMMFVAAPFLGENANYDTAEWLGYISMIVALSAIFIGIKSYRDKESGGFITFGNAFKVGLFITLVASVFYVAGWMLYINTSETNFMDKYYEQNIEKIRSSGDAEADIQARIADMEKQRESYKNPLVQVGFTFIEIFPVGLLITIISATILKKKSPAIEQG